MWTWTWLPWALKERFPHSVLPLSCLFGLRSPRSHISFLLSPSQLPYGACFWILSIRRQRECLAVECTERNRWMPRFVFQSSQCPPQLVHGGPEIIGCISAPWEAAPYLLSQRCSWPSRRWQAGPLGRSALLAPQTMSLFWVASAFSVFPLTLLCQLCLADGK